MHKRSSVKVQVLTIAIGLLLLLLVPVKSSADDGTDIDQMSLDELLGNIVVSASKKAERLDATPSNVFVITRDMIEDYGCQDIAEALSMAPGIYITNDYSLSQIGIRGVSDYGDWNSHVLVLVDGKPMNEQYGGTSSIDATGLDIDNIERIEVIKGPSSSLYGSNAFYGLINLISKKPIENSVSVDSKYNSRLQKSTVSASLFRRLASDATFSLDGTVSDQKGSKLYFPSFSDLSDINLLTQDNDGYNQYYLDSSTFTGGWSDKKNTIGNYAIRSKINYRNFYSSIHFAKMNTGIAQSMWGSVFNSSENRYKEQNLAVDMGINHTISNNINLKSRLGYTHYTWSDHVIYNYNIWEIDPDYLPGPIWKDWELDESFTVETQAQISVTPSYEMIVGGEVQFHKVRHESGEADETGEIISDNVIPVGSIEQKGRIYNLYVQNELTLSQRLKVVGGLHLNHYTYTTGKAMPKGAVVFKPYDAGTYKAIIGRGFKSPSFYELTYTDGEYYAANPDLKPELITNYEFISSHSLQNGIFFDISTSYSKVTNQIAQMSLDISDPTHPGGGFLDGVSQFRNLGERNIWSTEVSVRRKSIYRLSGFASVTYQDVELKDELNPTTKQFNSPSWLATTGMSYRLQPDRIIISGRINYISERYTWDESLLPSIWTIDGSLKADNLVMGVDIGVGVKNILNHENRVPLGFDYAPSTSIQSPGRSVYIQLGSSVNL